jgi:hypothetical protein
LEEGNDQQEESEESGRRSKRQRVPRLEYWRGERILPNGQDLRLPKAEEESLVKKKSYHKKAPKSIAAPPSKEEEASPPIESPFISIIDTVTGKEEKQRMLS